MARWQSHACAVLCLAAGCSGDHASLAQLSRTVEPHLQDFSRFETWAGRAFASSDPMASHETHVETTFAPVRLDSKVLYAEVISVEGEHQRKLHFPEEAVLDGIAEDEWQRISGPASRDLRASTAAKCPVKAPRWWRDGATEGPCVLLSNESNLGDQRTLKITVAYQTTDNP